MDGVLSVGELLFEHRQNYERQVHRAVSQKEFAEYIGIDDKNYNHIYTGRRNPSKKMLVHLVNFFDDMRFYDAVGEPRPEPELKYIQSSWGRLPKTIREQMYETAKTYIENKTN